MSAEATRRLHWPHDLHRHQPRRVSGDSLEHSWRRIELKLSVRCSMRSPPLATTHLQPDFRRGMSRQCAGMLGSSYGHFHSLCGHAPALAEAALGRG
jgi:hypothetical protein